MLFLNLLKESFLFAINALKVNRLRTLLTLLGITIGIFAIISVFTILDSLENTIRTSLSSLGDDILYIQQRPWGPDADGEYKWWEYEQRPVPSLTDYEQIKKKSDNTELVNFGASALRTIKYKSNTRENTIIWANTHEFEQVRSFELAEGRYFTQFESIAGKNVCILGHEIAKNLFQGQNPTGKQIKIHGKKTLVIGVFTKEGVDFLRGGGSLDEIIILPILYAKTLMDIESPLTNPYIMVKAKPEVSLEALKDELRGIIRTSRALSPRRKDNFAINQSSMLDSFFDSIFSVINLAGWFIGGFSILVGGFGIANIMFVSVKERTNLIGIQKSLGAKRKFILLQFLFEAVMLSLIGGAIGLIFIFIGSLIASSKIELEISLTLGNILLGLSISIAIGLISGIFPSYKAARLNPVEAINTTF